LNHKKPFKDFYNDVILRWISFFESNTSSEVGMRMRLMLWLVAGLLLVPVIALADDPFVEGKALFDRGEYAAAIPKLQQAYRDEPGNLDASFFLGRAAYESGDYEMSVAAFERILIMDPEAKRVKLELARAYLKLGSRDIAREYFKSVQATNPPPAVWQQIQQFIDSIDESEQKHLFNGFVTLGALYDDNVGAVSSKGTINIGDLPVRLDQQPESDGALQATAVLNHIYRFIDTPYVWKSTLTTYNNFYNDETDYDLNYFGVNTGPVYQDDDSLSELMGTAAQVDLQSDRYLGLLGVSFNHTRFLSRCLQLSLGASFLDKTYFHDIDRYRDAHTWALSANPVLTLDENRVSLNVVRENEDAKRDQYDYVRTLVGVRYDRLLPMDFAAYAGFRHQRTDYQDEEPLFREERSDQQTTWDVGLSKTLWRSDDRKQLLAAQVSYTHTNNESNLDLYSYDKSVTLTSLTFAY
jgi:tetratricopeptide (TPR) repeat protein